MLLKITEGIQLLYDKVYRWFFNRVATIRLLLTIPVAESTLAWLRMNSVTRRYQPHESCDGRPAAYSSNCSYCTTNSNVQIAKILVCWTFYSLKFAYSCRNIVTGQTCHFFFENLTVCFLSLMLKPYWSIQAELQGPSNLTYGPQACCCVLVDGKQPPPVSGIRLGDEGGGANWRTKLTNLA